MLRITFKSLAARKLRLALTAIAIVLGVAFVTGTYILTDTSNKLFDEQFADVVDGVDLVVRSDAAFDAAMGVEVERDPVPDTAVTTIESTGGVKAAMRQVQGQALLFDPAGEPIVPSGASVGMSWAPPPFGAFELRRGAPPSEHNEVVIDAATSSEYGIDVGDSIKAQGAAETETFRVSGVVGFGERAGMPNATVALFTYAKAGKFFDVTGGASQVLVVAENSGTSHTLRDTLSQRIGTDYEISTSRDTAAGSAAAAKAELSIVRLMLLAIAGTALLVGAFLIANTFSITVTQRVRELAVLRAVGATGRQTLVSVLLEATVVGAVASAAGAGLGIVAAYGLRGVVAAAGVDLPDGPLVVAPRTITLAVALGLTVTIVSALAAARRASRIAPVEAMRSGDVPVRRMPLKRRVVGGFAAVSGIGLATTAAIGITPSLGAAGGSVVFVIVALAALAPAFAGRLAGVVGLPLRRVGVAGALARGSAQRSPRRTAATTGALAIGLAVVTFVTVLGASVKASTAEGFDETISAQLVIESARSEMLGGLSHHVHHKVSELDEVGPISKLRFGHWQQTGATKALTAIDPATLPALATIDVIAGSFDDLKSGGVAIADTTAAAEGVTVGDTLPMTFARTGEKDMPIKAIFDQEDQFAVSSSYLISLDTYSRHFTEDVDAVVYLSAAPGVTVGQLRAAVDDVLAKFPTAVVRDEAEARATRTASLDQILAMVTVLLLFAVMIALLGITNTLALSIVERTREIGLLRAVGMTRTQVRSMIRWEALLIAVLGAGIGLGLGVGFGWIVVRTLSAEHTISLTVPGTQLVTYLLVVGVAGMLAGLLPARRAARLDVLQSIATS